MNDFGHFSKIAQKVAISLGCVGQTFVATGVQKSLK